MSIQNWLGSEKIIQKNECPASILTGLRKPSRVEGLPSGISTIIKKAITSSGYLVFMAKISWLAITNVLREVHAYWHRYRGHIHRPGTE